MIMNKINMNEGQRYEHDCPRCKFIGTWRDADLWFHPSENVGASVIARYSSEPSDNASGFAFAKPHANPALFKCAKQAQSMGLVPQTSDPMWRLLDFLNHCHGAKDDTFTWENCTYMGYDAVSILEGLHIGRISPNVWTVATTYGGTKIMFADGKYNTLPTHLYDELV